MRGRKQTKQEMGLEMLSLLAQLDEAREKFNSCMRSNEALSRQLLQRIEEIELLRAENMRLRGKGTP